MTTMNIFILISGIIIIQALVWIIIFWWMKKKSRKLSHKILEKCRMTDEEIIIEPKSGLCRVSNTRFGKVNGNGVICLTKNKLIFEMLTGQSIEISRSEIADATVEESFNGKRAFATGGKYLVIKTKDGSRIGFLIKDAKLWVQKIAS